MELLEEHFTSDLLGPALVVVDSPDVNSPEIQATLSALIETLDQDDAFFQPFDVRIN